MVKRLTGNNRIEQRVEPGMGRKKEKTIGLVEMDYKS